MTSRKSFSAQRRQHTRRVYDASIVEKQAIRFQAAPHRVRRLLELIIQSLMIH